MGLKSFHLCLQSEMINLHKMYQVKNMWEPTSGSNALFLFPLSGLVVCELLADDDTSEEWLITGEDDSEAGDVSSGPNTDNSTGNNTRPWNRPKATVKEKTLKNVRKTCPVERQQRRRARNVVIPPFATAGPMLVTAVTDFSCREPEIREDMTSHGDVF